MAALHQEENVIFPTIFTALSFRVIFACFDLGERFSSVLICTAILQAVPTGSAPAWKPFSTVRHVQILTISPLSL
jgi:hypothetical protein